MAHAGSRRPARPVPSAFAAGALATGAADCTGLRGGIDARNHFARNNGLAVALDDFNQHATIRCRQFEDDLVGLDVDQVFIPRDGFAGLLVPGNQGRFGD
jgi:hypothetical protein